MGGRSKPADEESVRLEMDREFIGGFYDSILKPEGLEYGLCVAYKLFDKTSSIGSAGGETYHKVAATVTPTKDDGPSCSQPPSESGGYYPAPLCMFTRLKPFLTHTAPWWYLESPELLPGKDWKIEWAAGTYELTSQYFALFDFTHPRVKGVFTAFYAYEGYVTGVKSAIQSLHHFQESLEAAKARMDANQDDCAWRKIVQWNSECRERAYYPGATAS